MTATEILSIMVENRYIPAIEQQIKETSGALNDAEIKRLSEALDYVIEEDIHILNLDAENFKIETKKHPATLNTIICFYYCDEQIGELAITPGMLYPEP